MNAGTKQRNWKPMEMRRPPQYTVPITLASDSPADDMVGRGCVGDLGVGAWAACTVAQRYYSCR